VVDIISMICFRFSSTDFYCYVIFLIKLNSCISYIGMEFILDGVKLLQLKLALFSLILSISNIIINASGIEEFPITFVTHQCYDFCSFSKMFLKRLKLLFIKISSSYLNLFTPTWFVPRNNLIIELCILSHDVNVFSLWSLFHEIKDLFNVMCWLLMAPFSI